MKGASIGVVYHHSGCVRGSPSYLGSGRKSLMCENDRYR